MQPVLEWHSFPYLGKLTDTHKWSRREMYRIHARARFNPGSSFPAMWWLPVATDPYLPFDAGVENERNM